MKGESDREVRDGGRTPVIPETLPHEGEANSSESSPVVVPGYEDFVEIGSGGFGIVYQVQQTRPVRRLVALKVLKRGLDTREIVARFRAEQQALAMMDHSCIATVYDAGETEAGQPYFAMELVSEGQALTQYCDAKGLTLEERLQLFVKVCQGVHHAHQKGVLHRDLKPSNVLVTEKEGVATPKIIDFGIAKALDESLGDITLRTSPEHTPGTPVYMSPEQATPGTDIDTRSDIYSLGVLFYQLVAGCHPLGSASVSRDYEAIKKRIRDESPKKPSSALHALSTEEKSSIAAKRCLSPEKLRSMFQGDLDWIALTALEKDREKRYASAAAFADDIGRYLADEPVAAAAPSTIYLLRKFARRQKAALSVAAAIVTLLVLGSLVSLSFAIKANRASRERSLQQAKSISESAVGAGRRAEGLLALAEAAGLKSEVVELRSAAAALLALDDIEFQQASLTKATKANMPSLTASITDDGLQAVITVCDVETGNTRCRIQRTQFPWIPIPEEGLLRFSPDHSRLACAGPATSMHLIIADTTSGELMNYVYTKDTLTHFAWHPSGKIIGSGHDDAVVRLWRPATDTSGTNLTGPEADLPPKLALAVNATDQAFVQLTGHRGPITQIAFHPSGDVMASLDSTGRFRLWGEISPGLAPGTPSQIQPTLLLEMVLDGQLEPTKLRFDASVSAAR